MKNKKSMRCLFTILSSLLVQFTVAQVIQSRILKQTQRESVPAVIVAKENLPAEAIKSMAVNTSIENNIKLSDGKVLKTFFTVDQPLQPVGNQVSVRKVNISNANSGSMIIAAKNKLAKDQVTVYQNTKHNVDTKDNQNNTGKDANGMVCSSGTTTFSINSTDQMPIGSKEFIQRFKPGTVFDLLQESAMMHSISNNRKPITLYCNESNESVTVNNPTETDLSSAIASLLKNLPTKSSSIISAKSEEINSEEEFALKISGGGKCVYGAVSGLFDFNKSKSAYHFLYDFSEEVAVLTADNKNDAFFSDLTLQNNPTYGFVKAATYGRRILVCVETKKYSSADQEKLDATFNAVFASGEVHLDRSQKTMFSNCTVKVFAVGGSTKDAALISIAASDPASLKLALQNYLSNFDNSMLLPIKVNMSDLNGVPKKTEMSGNVPYVKCYNPTERFRLSIKTVELVSMNAGVRSSYRMWGGFSIRASDKDGNEIADVYQRNPQVMVADNSSNYVTVQKGEQNSYKCNNNFNREFQMDTREDNAKIIFTTALDDNGDFSDSQQKGEYTLYMKDILAAIAAGNNGSESDGIAFNVNGGGFSLKITFTISK